MAYPHLYGKKAIIVSMNQATACGFEVGQKVEIVHNPMDASREDGRIRVVNEKGTNNGYFDLKNLEIVEEHKLENLVGKKAILLSKEGATCGFEVGGVVEIVSIKKSGRFPLVIKPVGDRDLQGYTNPEWVKIIGEAPVEEPKEEESNGAVKVEYQGFVIEGNVSDVLRTLKGLVALA